MDLSRLTSITQTEAYSGTSDRYSFIPTTRVLDMLAQYGWFPMKAEQARVRKAELSGFQKHLIRCRHKSMLENTGLGSTIPEILVKNAHGGQSTSFELMLGMLEQICGNGLVINSTWNSYRIRHTGFTDDKVSDAIQAILEQAPRAIEGIEQFKTIRLERPEQLALAQAAIELRYDGDKFAVKPEHVLSVRHYQQKEPTLWNTFNVIQENVIKGGVPQYRSDSTRIRARAVNSINENLRLNRALWTLTEEMAKLKA